MHNRLLRFRFAHLENSPTTRSIVIPALLTPIARTECSINVPNTVLRQWSHRLLLSASVSPIQPSTTEDACVAKDSFAVRQEPLISVRFALLDTGALNKPPCASARTMPFRLLGRTRLRTAPCVLLDGTRTANCLVVGVWLVMPVPTPPPRAFAVREPLRQPSPLPVLRV